MADRGQAPKATGARDSAPGLSVRALVRNLSGDDADRSDNLLYQRIRLGILSALAVNSRLTFSDLRQLLKTTDGNLGVHARKLEDAGLIDCRKSFRGRIPRTEYRLTSSGREALERYLNHMEALLQATRRGT